MKKLFIIPFVILVGTGLKGQILKKLKDKVVEKTNQKTDAKADQTIDKSLDSLLSGKSPVKIPNGNNNGNNNTNETGTTEIPASTQAKKTTYNSKFDFVPGSTVIYYDNFEKDNIGETPLGWITSTSAEVVTIDEQEDNWVKLSSMSSNHLIRNKKQSWGNNFTIEFDLLIIKNTYDPRIDINLVNTGGSLVTDEQILRSGKAVINFSAIIAQGNSSRASLYALDKKISDVMTENLPYSDAKPVHISMCVQGKRFRMWWNDRKLYDLSAVSEEYLPNQLGFSFGSVGGSDFFITNIRVAKDVPDTRARFEQGKLISNLLFYTGTANLKPESMGSLLDVSKVIKTSDSPVKIVGHTDSDGDATFNQKLSEQRANEVKKILETVYNINSSLLTTEGRGESQPIADNNSSEGKAQNRRVEFIFKPEADTYTKPAGLNEKPVEKGNSKPGNQTNSSSTSAASNSSKVSLQSKILTVSLPYAQFMKTADNRFTFIASKDEGNSKENFIKIELESDHADLKPGTYNFKEINQLNSLYGVKKFPEIKSTDAVLYYGTSKTPFINKFTPVIANGHMSSYVDESLRRNLPAASPSCKLVIEKIEDGKASGFFTAGILVDGLKPVKKGDAMQETFTTGFSGEMKCRFSDIPVY